MGRTRGLDSRTAAMVAGELLLIQRYLVHLPAELSHARGKASPTAWLAGRASLAVDCLRSQLGNRLARDRRRAPSPGRPLSALSAQGHHCRKDIVVGDDNKSLPEGPRRCIRAASRPGDVFLDPFAGAGTTGLAARKLQQDCVLLDISAEYVQMMRERLEGKKHDEAGAAQIEIDSGDPLRHLGLPDDCADRGAGIVPPPQELPAPDSDAVLGA